MSEPGIIAERDTHGYKVLCIVGARPNLMKMAPLLRALGRTDNIVPILLHTGQHYDPEMSGDIIAALGIAKPDIRLEIGSDNHARQTARIMLALDPVVDDIKPDLVLVVGDVNSTLAATLVAAKKGIPVAHIEAGLRSFDRTMPEEINRVLTDQMAELLFATEGDAVANLAREGIDGARIHLVGNVMIDTLLAELDRSRQAGADFLSSLPAPWTLRAASAGHAFVTLHRPSNIDHRRTCERLLMTIATVARKLPVVFALHPRTRKIIAEHDLSSVLDHPLLHVTGPLSYHQTIGIVAGARLVLTDSGGLQEETTGLGVPCLTLRDNTERPVTVREGSNLVVGTDPAVILAAVEDVLQSAGKRSRVPALWDGKAAERIVEVLSVWFAARAGQR